MKKGACWQVRILVWHCVSLFQLMRGGLSVFREAYDFYSSDFSTVRDLPQGALDELRGT